MKKHMAALAIAMLGSIGTIIAQSKADRVFNIADKYIYNTHTVHLADEAHMVIEMADVTDYTMIKNLDSIVSLAVKDAEIYKDSFQVMDNIRIDYVLKKESDNTLMRFKKYGPEGSVYVKRNGEFARLKMEQDTLRIILKKPVTERDSHMHFYDFPVQITFLLNNYSDINTLLSDKGLLNHIVDTLSQTSFPKVYKHNISEHRTTIDYYPFTAGKKLVKVDLEGDDERQASLKRK